MHTLFPPRPLFVIPLPSGRMLSLGERCLVMGILNVTPDSFADAARLDAGAAVEMALRMEDAGADLLDVGGESTRPGARPISEDEELARVVPVVRALAARTTLPISVDTQKAAVARAAILEGAVIVNDVSALAGDADMADAIASSGAAVVLMHHRGTSADMYERAAYTDVASEVAQELAGRLTQAVAAGIPLAHTIVDPGIGFAKRPEHNYGVLARLPEVGRALSRPLLVGPSRKSFMSAALGNRPAPARDWGTAAAVTAAVLAGAHIVRVHAVEEMGQVVRVAEEMRRV